MNKIEKEAFGLGTKMRNRFAGKSASIIEKHIEEFILDISKAISKCCKIEQVEIDNVKMDIDEKYNGWAKLSLWFKEEKKGDE